jgi:hypothetical protein
MFTGWISFWLDIIMNIIERATVCIEAIVTLMGRFISLSVRDLVCFQVQIVVKPFNVLCMAAPYFAGSAGAPLDAFYAATTTYDKPWTAKYLQGAYGYGKLEGDERSLHFSFIRHGDFDDPQGGQVLDSLLIPRKYLA